jgi:hypothetical protein
VGPWEGDELEKWKKKTGGRGTCRSGTENERIIDEIMERCRKEKGGTGKRWKVASKRVCCEEWENHSSTRLRFGMGQRWGVRGVTRGEKCEIKELE